MLHDTLYAVQGPGARGLAYRRTRAAVKHAIRGLQQPPDLLGGGRSLRRPRGERLFLHSGRVDAEVLAVAGARGAQVYAEFGTLRGDALLPRYPDVAPVGPDGLPAPRTPRFLGACPTCPGLLLEKGRACAAWCGSRRWPGCG